MPAASAPFRPPESVIDRSNAAVDPTGMVPLVIPSVYLAAEPSATVALLLLPVRDRASVSLSAMVVRIEPDAVAEALLEIAAFDAATVKLSEPSTSESSNVGSVNVQLPSNVESSDR